MALAAAGCRRSGSSHSAQGISIQPYLYLGGYDGWWKGGLRCDVVMLCCLYANHGDH